MCVDHVSSLSAITCCWWYVTLGRSGMFLVSVSYTGFECCLIEAIKWRVRLRMRPTIGAPSDGSCSAALVAQSVSAIAS